MTSNNNQSIKSLFPALIQSLNQFESKNSFDYKATFDTYYSKLLVTPTFENINLKMEVDFYKRELYVAGLPFTFLWEVNQFSKIIKSADLLPYNYNVSRAYAVVDKSNILPHILTQVSSDPIIVGKIPFITPSEIVLDGNHRVVSAHNNNKGVISAYILDPELHTQAMHPYLRTLFLTLTNIQYILQHIDGIIDSKELEERLYDLN